MLELCAWFGIGASERVRTSKRERARYAAAAQAPCPAAHRARVGMGWLGPFFQRTSAGQRMLRSMPIAVLFTRLSSIMFGHLSQFTTAV
jgi:hypothetical protein